nr:carbohydrate kinase [Salinihabitans flavidus]
MILTCGEAVIDMLPATTGDGRPCFAPACGGAAVNVAIALARLGQRAGFFGGLSTDAFGRLLRDRMAGERVDLSRAAVTPAPSTLAFVHLTEGSPEFSFFDEASAGRCLSHADLPALDGVGALVFGGISLLRTPGAGTFEALMQRAGPERLCVLDANVRPALIGTEVEAAYRARLARMMAQADVIKLSDEDFDWLRPGPPAAFLSGRVALVLVTHGAGGATAHSRHGALHLPAPQVTVADTVGAGDSFLAAVLALLSDRGQLTPQALALAPEAVLHDALAHGIRAASLSVTRPGADPPTTGEMR